MLSSDQGNRYCLRHKLELNLLGVPVTKICTVCGETRLLREEELCWPAPRPNSGAKNPPVGHLHLRRKNARLFRVIILGGLLALGSSIAWIAWTPFSVGTNTITSRISFPGGTSSHQTEKGTVGAAPERPTALSDAKDQTPTNRPSANRSLQGSAEWEATESEQGEMTLGLGVVTDYGQIQHSASARTATEQSEEIYPGAQVDTTTASVAQQVSKAITARAISGVKVSYAESTVYLAGIVKTQRQRSAAEQAARNVPGVKEIRSSIRVQWANDNG